ncbi:Folylpolyglutamate synthase [Chlamydiales bacterium SCGC AB-751-O23]|jgi:dihydrofolate synthase / folylpolyglutamate synthase|nr:Folylpolyglutamate synthase [Chlamydiales bacterium SCGC AB-751-O23]
MNYQDSLKILEKLQGEASPFLSLEKVKKLLEALGNPHKKFNVIHVAGTNGKGSVVSKTARALRVSGYKVGSFISPHIECIRERVRVNDEYISEEDFARYFSFIHGRALQGKVAVSFFEMLFTLASVAFSDKQVKFACVEVGLGGRLDATNLVDPMLCIITNVSLDHQRILGNTVEEIAREKAGIIKEKVPVIAGSNLPKSIIAQVAKEKKSPLKIINVDNLEFTEANSILAIDALDFIAKKHPISADSYLAARTFSLPCRFEVLVGESLPEGSKVKALILDGAHNYDGLASLIFSAKKHFPEEKLYFLGNFSKLKERPEMLDLLKPHFEHFFILDYPHPRLMPAKETLEYFPQNKSSLVSASEEELLKVLLTEDLEGGVLISCGSFFFQSWIRNSLEKTGRSANASKAY